MRTFTSTSTIRVLGQNANIHKNGVYRIVVTLVVSTMSSFVSSDNNGDASDHDPTNKLTCSDRIRWWGDIGHVATLFSAVVFAVSVITLVDQQKNDGGHDQHDNNGNNENGISNKSSSSFLSFDPQWQREGFCVAHPETPSVSSHAVCLYVDVLLAVVMALTYWPHRNRTALRHANLLVSTNVLATIGHGLAHGGLAYHMYQQLQQKQTGMANEDAAVQTKETATMMDWFVLPVLFWLPLMKASMSNAPMVVVAISALLANGLLTTVPPNLGFTTVQTILLVAFSCDQLLRPPDEKRDLHYVLFAWMVSFPLTLVGWMESTMCTAFVRSALYGHLGYDAYIPLSLLAFYLLCIRNANHHQQQQTTKTQKID
jgi:hypothetical protein